MIVGAPPAAEACSECGSSAGPGDILHRRTLAEYQATGQAYWFSTCENPWHEIKRAERLSVMSGLLPSEQGHTLDEIVERGEGSHAMIEAVQKMIERPYGLLTLWGGPGNGKTLALQTLVAAFMANGQGAVYVRLPDLLDHLRDGFDPDAPVNAHDRYRQVAETRLLAIDEFDKPRLTPWSQEVIFILVDDRYRYARERGPLQRHTVIAMNTDPETLSEYLVSRLRYGLYDPDGFRIVHNTDTDLRRVGL